MGQSVVVVCGYGCHLVPELRSYLDRVVTFCKLNEPDTVIFCGGPTQQKTAPGQTEAEVMYEYVQAQLHCQLGTSVTFLFVRDGYTALDNIADATESMHRRCLLTADTTLTVFCEATRALSIDLLVRHFMGRRATIETASWEQASPTKQLLSTFYTWLSINFPPLRGYFRNKRVRRAKEI